ARRRAVPRRRARHRDPRGPSLRAAADAPLRSRRDLPRELLPLQHAGRGPRARGRSPRRDGVLPAVSASEPTFDSLYRDLILEHYKAPHGKRPCPREDVLTERMNPICGDEVEVARL